ncbi:ran-binding protein [Ophiostoma piceae UAMH 11346]|uniref:Ran-binding protein n=1 Tax=Ophiostoma piceae (strain UAMH 11346) TaxID=1262450 RepID=S3CBD4_OPHP1|nr:ran-binding protein [Ophiostoma piceae UAMH 11346]
MSNPYHIPSSDLQDDASANPPAGIPGYPFRRSSYASVASGTSTFNRSGATFQQLLNNNPSSADGSNSALQPPYADNNVWPTHDHQESLRLASESFAHWYLNPPLPPHSRAFEPLVQTPIPDGFGPASSNRGFFTPSYLRDSVYVQRLHEQYKAKIQAAREAQQQQQQLNSGPSSTGPHVSALAAASAAAAAGGSVGNCLNDLDVGTSGTGFGAFSIGGVSSPGTGGPGSKIGPGSHRGIAYDVIEKSGANGFTEDEEPLVPLPAGWSNTERSSLVDVMSDSLDAKFTSSKTTADREQEVGAIRADSYMPPQCGIYYYEVTILTKKRDDSEIAIGFSGSKATLTRHPGWEAGSWGYHSDDGNVFSEHSSNNGKQYGPAFGTCDIVGCGVNFRTGTAFFTKNGEHLGVAFRDQKMTAQKLFPTIGLKKQGDHIRANFGQAPFTFDIDGMMKGERDIINREIQATSTSSLAPSLNETELVQQLVLQFLQHDGYVETARAFAEEIHAEKQALNLDLEKEVEGINIADDEDAHKRQRIRQAILEGDIDHALELTKADYPDVLNNNAYVLFRLKCRKFIEIIRSEAELKIVSGGNEATSSADSTKQPNGHSRQGSQQQNMDLDDIDMVEDGTNGQRDSRALATAAIEYGKSLQAQYTGSTDPEIVETLAEIFSLFAYENPLKQREVSHLLEQKGRVAVAEELNAVILESLGKSSRSAFENVYAQTTVLLEDLRPSGGPGCFITVNSVLDDIPKSY